MQTTEEILHYLGAGNLDTVKPALIDKNSRVSVDHLNINPPTTENMYSSSDLAKFPMFSGGYINFGLWKGIDFQGKKISIEDRILSSENLYHYVLDSLSLNSASEALEMGSGQGYGCVLLAKKYKVRKVCGLDATKEQIARSLITHAEILKSSPNLKFFIGNAEQMPFPDNSFSHAFSIEAAHHFSSIPNFVSEAYRVLNPNGQFIITTFFAKDEASVNKLKLIIPDFYVHMSDFTIEEVKTVLEKSHFEDIQIDSIGEFVWGGIDAWLNQVVPKMWSRIWLKAYHGGLIDYYVIRAKVPGSKVFAFLLQ